MEKFLNKKSINNIIFILILVLVLGFCVRFLLLGKVPASMNRDEAAIGYNAYSILKTGKDEWGVKFPFIFKSFGDYKSPLYIYLTVLPIKIFGLTEFSVRFWGAVAGFLLIIVTYFLVNKLLIKGDVITALCAAFIMAIGSWQIFYSRFSFEANLALLFNAIILYYLVKDDFKKINWLLFLFLPLTLLSYSSSLIIWPIFIFIWSLFLLKKIFHKQVDRLQLLKLFILLIALFFVIYNQISISGQKGKITIFRNVQLRLDYNEQRTVIAQKNLWQARFFYNQYLYYGKIFFNNYFKSFLPNFLFGGGGEHPWHKIPQTPHFYKIYLILILIGLNFFIKTEKISKENKIFLILFFIITPVASAITIDSPHATRLLNLFFILSFFAGLGLGVIIKKVKPLGILILFILTINFLCFTKFYFVNFRQNPVNDLLPGIKEVIDFINENKLKADRIIYDNNNDGSYIYIAFYNKYQPLDFIQHIKRYSPDTIGFEWVERLDSYIFVNNPVPDPNYREVYILRARNYLNQKLITQIKNIYNDKIYYIIATNF